jgi:NitT/TauT family transport system permease protein
VGYSFRGDFSKYKIVALATLPFLVVLLLWTLLSYWGLVQPLLLPSPWATASELIGLFSGGDFLNDILASLARIATGFAIATLVGIPLGIATGTFRSVEALVVPLMAFIRYMPASAFIPLVILWFGIGFWEKVIVVFLSIFFYFVLMVADAAMNVRRDLIETALTLGATRRHVLTRVIVPGCLPDVWNAARVMMGVGWTMIVVVEMVAAQDGVGAMIVHAQRFLQTPKVIAGIMAIGVLGILSDGLFKVGHMALFPWVEK